MSLLDTQDNVLGDYSPEVGFQPELNRAEDLVSEYEHGHMKASEAYVQLRSIKEQVEEILNNAIGKVESGVVDELTQLDDKEDLIVMGSKISHVKGRTSYQYKQCPMYVDADKEVKRVRELIKTATKNGVEIIDQESGEMIEPVEVKQGKGYLKLEKAK
ncbi:hypothetical protein [Gracilimonas sediminicola]|uniref:Uncharacterized protein n=1 Tax=Gracilimonas sediminicola TaxID=2952158 RepID=A0A9X2L0P1_9BACT|nr:hypothetical protein [Gracilimonas sediminicola]MCP9290040.1 hypothetical protein [Gracilimonas sediminicola]